MTSRYGKYGDCLWIVCRSIGSIDFHQQSLDIKLEIGDRNGVARSLFNQALALTKYETRRLEAIDNLHQARSIYLELGLTHRVENCDNAIHNFKTATTTTSQQWWMWFAAGLAIALIIWWWKK
jgi:Mg2+/citrate symporter